jgi:peptidyl-prolyl cis-trans isomerase D
MLEFIRERAKGIIAWAIVALIAIPFALWGINNYFTGPKTIVVAEVNGEDISAVEFLRVYQRQKQQLQQQLGDAYEQLVDDQKLRKEILDSLIESKLIQQWAVDHHMAISDAQLAMVIQSAPIFLDEKGQFSQQKYEQVLATNGLSVAQFEQLQRLFLLEQQYRALTQVSTLSTEQEWQQLAQLQQQQRKVGWLQFDLKPYIAQVKISDSDIEAYYQAHKDTFVEPEKVIVEYVLLDKRQLAKQIQPTDEQLKAFYQDNQDLFTVPEQRHARHILILAKKGEADSEAEAQKKIAEIQAKLEAGESFEKLAQAYSQDPGSASSGGDLGYFEQGMMVPEFDQKVFSMKPGEISEPVQTQFGYHIIQLLDIKPKRVQTFAEVKDRVLQLYREQEADKQYYDLLEQLNTQAYEQPDSLVPAAEAIGGSVLTSKPFSRESGEGMFAHPKVKQAVFGDEVYNQHLNSQVIELGSDRAIVVRLKEVIPTKQLSLAEVKEQIAQQLQQEKAQALAKEAAEQLLAQLKQGESIDNLLTPQLQWHAPHWVGRGDAQIPAPILEAVFKAPKPSDKPVWQMIMVQDAPVIVKIEAVRVNQKELPEVLQKQLRKALAGILGDAEMKSRIAQLKKTADIEIHNNYLTVN